MKDYFFFFAAGLRFAGGLRLAGGGVIVGAVSIPGNESFASAWSATIVLPLGTLWLLSRLTGVFFAARTDR